MRQWRLEVDVGSWPAEVGCRRCIQRFVPNQRVNPVFATEVGHERNTVLIFSGQDDRRYITGGGVGVLP